MKVKLICEECLTFTLTKEELSRYGLTSEELSPDSRRTRRLLARMLVLAKLETGMSFEGKKLYLQVFPVPDGGCIFLFTSAKILPGGQKREGEFPVHIYGFPQLSLLTEGCTKLKKQFGSSGYQSALYLCEGVYYLVLLQKGEDPSPFLFLREYTSLVYDKPVFLSFVAEHGKKLISSDAVSVLAGI